MAMVPVQSTFYANGGAFASGETSIYVNGASSSDTIYSVVGEPTQSGYVFLGWSTTENGTVEYDGSYSIELVSDQSCYAVWERDTSHDKCIFEKGAIDIIVDKIKNSSGGTPETCTINFNSLSGNDFYYETESGWQKVHTYQSSKNVEVKKKSFVCFDSWQCTSVDITGSIEKVYESFSGKALAIGVYYITGDGTLYADYEGNEPV